MFDMLLEFLIIPLPPADEAAIFQTQTTVSNAEEKK
jgi:hypothetical protein